MKLDQLFIVLVALWGLTLIVSVVWMYLLCEAVKTSAENICISIDILNNTVEKKHG